MPGFEKHPEQAVATAAAAHQTAVSRVIGLTLHLAVQPPGVWIRLRLR